MSKRYVHKTYPPLYHIEDMKEDRSWYTNDQEEAMEYASHNIYKEGSYLTVNSTTNITNSRPCRYFITLIEEPTKAQWLLYSSVSPKGESGE